MRIKNKIVWYFSSATISFISLSFFFIYTLFAEYREEEFQKRLKDNTMTTLRFLAEVQENDRDVLQALDRFTINNLFQEKVLLFDADKRLIYASIDDTRIEYSRSILDQLSASSPWVESVEDKFDVVGVYLPFENKSFYGITKAYDTFGYSKLGYLRNVLIFSLVTLSIIVVLISIYLSKQISDPLTTMAMEITAIRPEMEYAEITIPDTKDEINFLGRQFNALMQRLKEAFSFQKHAIHHISHELKTPIAILVSNFEKMEQETDPGRLREYIAMQKEDTRNLSNIINALLEIAKAESGNVTSLKERVRVDDLIYDLIEEVRALHERFTFEVSVAGNIESEDSFTVTGNERLLRSAFLNLMVNCVNYSRNNKAQILIIPSDQNIELHFRNDGPQIADSERQFLFQHFFRGQNSFGKPGFGLGLVLIHKILTLHQGVVRYETEGEKQNQFILSIPLR